MENNLDRAIYDAQHTPGAPQTLTERQIIRITNLLGHRCRYETRERIERKLRMPLSLFKRHGIYSRLELTAYDDVFYICGQSWTDEMRTLRKCILDN